MKKSLEQNLLQSRCKYSAIHSKTDESIMKQSLEHNSITDRGEYSATCAKNRWKYNEKLEI